MTKTRIISARIVTGTPSTEIGIMFTPFDFVNNALEERPETYTTDIQ